MHLHLTKHHGLGNDFLVVLGEIALDGHQARRLCDRRRGIGADGLIVGAPPSRPGSDVTMELFNADGGRAEMSGNGIRCLAQAFVRHRGMHEGGVVVDAPSGARKTHVTAASPGSDGDTVDVCADLGPVSDGIPWRPSDASRAVLDRLGAAWSRIATADIGNPHLVVVVADPMLVDIAAVGPSLEADFPHGINVELIAPTADGNLDLVVWERGAGDTGACGTGAAAAAALAHRWGLVGPRVKVRMRGGDVTAHVGGSSAHLVGPATFVARIEVDLD